MKRGPEDHCQGFRVVSMERANQQQSEKKEPSDEDFTSTASLTVREREREREREMRERGTVPTTKRTWSESPLFRRENHRGNCGKYKSTISTPITGPFYCSPADISPNTTIFFLVELLNFQTNALVD